MSLELIAGLVAIVVALVGGGVGWDQIKRHGAEAEKRKQAEGEVDALKKQATQHREPLRDDVGHLARLRLAAAHRLRLRRRDARPRDD